MSLILNALKKVEEKQRREGAVRQFKTQRPKNRYWIDIIIIIIIGIITGAIIGTAFVKITSPPAKAKKSPASTETVTKQKTAEKKPIPANKTKTVSFTDKVKNSVKKLFSGKAKSKPKEKKDGEPKTASQGKQYKSQNLTLTGIMWDKELPMAIINEQLLKEGDTIQGTKIIKIKESQVIIRTKDKEYVLSIQ